MLEAHPKVPVNEHLTNAVAMFSGATAARRGGNRRDGPGAGVSAVRPTRNPNYCTSAVTSISVYSRSRPINAAAVARGYDQSPALLKRSGRQLRVQIQYL